MSATNSSVVTERREAELKLRRQRKNSIKRATHDDLHFACVCCTGSVDDDEGLFLKNGELSDHDPVQSSLTALQKQTDELRQDTPFIQSTSSNEGAALLGFLPTDEDEYIDIFQDYMCNGDSLKDDISSQLLSIEGVESISIGFSNVKKGFWPVVRISPDEKKCKEIKYDEEKTKFVSVITHALQKVLIKLYKKTWEQKELEKMIEVAVNYPLTFEKLCTAGQELVTKYTLIDDGPPYERTTITERGTATCNVHHCLRVGGDNYSCHYTITGFHPIIPARCPQFRDMLPTLPTETDAQIPAKHICVNETISGIKQCNGYQNEFNNPHLIPTLLRASVFPDEANEAFSTTRSKFDYQITFPMKAACGIEENIKNDAGKDNSGDNDDNDGYLIGKAGLIKRTCTHEPNETHTPLCNYFHIIVNNTALDLNDQHVHVSHFSHPCNIDIAALKRKKDDKHPCSFEETLAIIRAKDPTCKLQDEIKWEGPPKPGIRSKRGTVVLVKQETMYKLSDKITTIREVEVGKNNEKYPYCDWELTPGNTIPQHGDSGSPVFLKKDIDSSTTFNLLGPLITRTHASPIDFSLELIKYDVSIDHVQQVIKDITKQKREFEQEGKQAEAGALETKIKCLKDYNCILKENRDNQSLQPLPTKWYNELSGDGNIASEMKICINSH